LEEEKKTNQEEEEEEEDEEVINTNIAFQKGPLKLNEEAININVYL
jgi:hypothetical protein